MLNIQKKKQSGTHTKLYDKVDQQQFHFIFSDRVNKHANVSS